MPRISKPSIISDDLFLKLRVIDKNDFSLSSRKAELKYKLMPQTLLHPIFNYIIRSAPKERDCTQ